MKKILLSAFAAFTVSAALAQAIQPQNPPSTVTGSFATGNILAASFTVVNPNSQSVVIKVARTMIQEVPGSENNFCWGVDCYPPNISVSPNPVTMAASSSNNSFVADYTPNNNPGITKIRYSFFKTTGSPDSAHVTINFDATSAVSGVRKNMDAADMIGMPSPNPANSLTTIPYSVPAGSRNSKLRIMNAIGGTVKEIELVQKQGNILLVTNDLPSGIYFYNLQVDGRSVTTKKLIVRH